MPRQQINIEEWGKGGSGRGWGAGQTTKWSNSFVRLRSPVCRVIQEWGEDQARGGIFFLSIYSPMCGPACRKGWWGNKE